MRMHVLKQNTAEYKIFPKVVLKNNATEFVAEGLGIETKLKINEEYIIRIIPQEEIATARTLRNGDDNSYDEIKIKADENSRLCFTYTFNNEELYTLRLLNSSGERLTDFRIYSLEEDLWQRTPMKGNTHCHACHSVDGHEDPVVAASVYRKAGFDYLAITDHHKIDGSMYAVENMKNIPTEMALYYGEEVHVPNAYIHAVNVGAVLEGGVGLDKWYHDHEEEVNKIVKETAEYYKDKLPSGIEPYDFAFRKWIADTIHENGGVAIIAHPFWEYDANNMRNSMFRYLTKTKLYDAAEVIFGQDDPDSKEANRIVAFWNDMRADGMYISPLGCDDAHRRSFKWNYECNFNRAYTVIFAENSSFGGFKEAINKGYSVAIETYDDAPEHVVGTYRLANYAIFLLEEYFPLHDELCFEEGCRIKEAYLGDEESFAVLKLINGRVKRYTDKFFGR